MENFTNTTGAAANWGAAEPEASHVFRLVLYAVIFSLTVLGNIFVIVLVIKTRELHSARPKSKGRFTVILPGRDTLYNPVTGYLICNLSIADLCVGLLCIPFTLTYAELKYWPFGRVMCKTILPAQAMAVMASVATLSAISFDRFRSIAYPYEARISVSKVKFIIASVWVMAGVMGLPLVAVLDVRLFPGFGKPICDEYGWPSPLYRRIYSTATFIVTYAVPLPLMATWYAIVVYKLEQAAHKGDDSEGFRVAQAKGKVVRMLIVVVAAYFVCFLPYHVSMMWLEFGDVSQSRFFWILLSYSHVLVYANSCINPILYCIFSEQFRRGFIKLCRCGYRSVQTFRRWSVTRNSRVDENNHKGLTPSHSLEPRPV
ncbi:RYamide receptor isoform X2 [Nematostella vectensis]|uniref:RYamide receptor isoform X2 n=1 Tax=Nematostella vectensis TaxID=45351 RepID=UPI0020770EED|nr:RYamide receptor isoform X2 [Nematostella vectensis]